MSHQLKVSNNVKYDDAISKLTETHDVRNFDRYTFKMDLVARLTTHSLSFVIDAILLSLIMQSFFVNNRFPILTVVVHTFDLN